VRHVALALLAVIVGCASSPTVNAPPGGATLTSAGLDETRPYVGRLKDPSSPDRDLGDFVLAYCGCSCWRVMISRADGTVRTQLLVHFSPQGTSESTAEVVVQGEAEGSIVTGTVNQNTGLAKGRALIGPYAMIFAADRNQERMDQSDTCIMCHLGEEPIWPLPSEHPEYQVAPPDCLSCHPLEY
jgi:hypothetical protein